MLSLYVVAAMHEVREMCATMPLSSMLTEGRTCNVFVADLTVAVEARKLRRSGLAGVSAR